MIYVFDRVENIVGKRENAFPLFPQGFLQLSFWGSLAIEIIDRKQSSIYWNHRKKRRKPWNFPFSNRPSLYLWHFYLWHFYLWYFYRFGSDIFTYGNFTSDIFTYGNFTSGIFTAHRGDILLSANAFGFGQFKNLLFSKESMTRTKKKKNFVGKEPSHNQQHLIQQCFPSNQGHRSIFSFVQSFNPFPHNDTFWHLWETSLLKTLWEKEKLFSTRLDNFMPFSSNLKLSSANPLSLEESKICRLVMG